MKLKNPACQRAGHCINECGMCHLKDGEKRVVHNKSLFGTCRELGYCDCGLCKGITKNWGQHDAVFISMDEIYVVAKELSALNQYETKVRRNIRNRENAFYHRFDGLIQKETLYV